MIDIQILTTLGIVALAALIHASFQLGVSVLTLLSGHSLSRKQSQFRVFRLTTSFVAGVATMSLLILSFFALFLGYVTTDDNHVLLWSIISGLLIGVGIAIWVFYYRPGEGTRLWVPRGIAAFLTDRTKATKRSAEAFSLGLATVLGELPFLIAPLAVSAYALIHLPAAWQVTGIALYVIISLSSLVIVWMLVGGGHKLSAIQAWRERHKRFLQFVAAAGLLILGTYTYVNEALVLTGVGL
ncbi:MAG TPA: hypothetical protein PKD28_04350 [Candidatus Saccharibacteria bacterium]|nr:hypothetical protein [Candidatus Saccharibacteria bacterium]